MDESELNEHLRELGPLAERVARSKGSPDPEAAAQEVLLRLSQLDPWPDNPEAWVRRATMNQVVDDWRRSGRRPKGGAGDVEERIPGVNTREAHRDTVDWLSGNLPTSAGGMQTIAYSWLRQRLAEVFTDDEIWLLSMVGTGISHAEIADRMGYKNAAVVKTTLARLRKKADGLDREELEQLLHHPRAY